MFMSDYVLGFTVSIYRRGLLKGSIFIVVDRNSRLTVQLNLHHLIIIMNLEFSRLMPVCSIKVHWAASGF